MVSDRRDLERVLNVARRIAVAAGDVLQAHFGTAMVQEKEQSHNLVTQADLEAEDLVTRMVQAEFPSHTLLREEAGATGDLQSEHLWIVDPLDGTNNYAHGMPHFSVSIAYARHGVPHVGVVLDPTRNEMFTAVAGSGAWLNDRPIRVSQRSTVPQSLVCTGFYYDRGESMERTLAAIRTLFQNNVRGIRRSGSAALDLSWVACGRYDGYFEYQLAPWDYAAGSLLVQEAGGQCYDRQGQPLQLFSQSMIAANLLVAKQLVGLVRWEDGER